MLLPSILLTTTLLSLPFLIHSTSLLCAGNLYGKPKLSDTITLGGYLPYVKSDPEGNMNAGRTFAEPAFFDPKFQGLMNTRDTSMVQLPLVWRFRSARLALLSYANAAGQVPLPIVYSNWHAVEAAAASMLQYCVKGQQGIGGVRILADTPLLPYLSLYLYASGSPFESVLNQYMITGRGVNPFNPRGFGSEGVEFNISAAMLEGVSRAVE